MGLEVHFAFHHLRSQIYLVGNTDRVYSIQFQFKMSFIVNSIVQLYISKNMTNRVLFKQLVWDKIME
jgi:hypothetical protein